jgi:hypothetical protein
VQRRRLGVRVEPGPGAARELGVDHGRREQPANDERGHGEAALRPDALEHAEVVVHRAGEQRGVDRALPAVGDRARDVVRQRRVGRDAAPRGILHRLIGARGARRLG